MCNISRYICAFLEQICNPTPSMILVVPVHCLIVYTCYYIFKLVTSLSFVRVYRTLPANVCKCVGVQACVGWQSPVTIPVDVLHGKQLNSGGELSADVY